VADATSTVILEVKPLVTSDADALTAGIQAAPFYQPAFVAETMVDSAGLTSMPTGLTINGDVWRIIFELASPMPGFVVYPICFIGNLLASAEFGAFANLFAPLAAYTISVAENQATVGGWQSFTLGGFKDLGPIPQVINTIAPDLRGFPVRPRTPGGGGVGTRVGELSLTIATAHVAATAVTKLDLDFRLLLFPEASALNAGFWTPLLFFHPQ